MLQQIMKELFLRKCWELDLPILLDIDLKIAYHLSMQRRQSYPG